MIRHFLFRHWDNTISIYEFYSHVKVRFLLEKDGRIANHNASNWYEVDEQFLPKFSEKLKLIEIDKNFNQIVGNKLKIDYCE